MTPRRSRIGRLLAALFIRGADAPFILRDLDDSFSHDVARSLAPAEVRRRDLRNILASAGLRKSHPADKEADLPVSPTRCPP